MTKKTNTAMYEFLGTFVLVSTICFVVTAGTAGNFTNIKETVVKGSDGTTTTSYSFDDTTGAKHVYSLGGMTFVYMIPMGLFVAVTLGANVSGACFNPAVTLACELRAGSGEGGKADWAKVITQMWLPQCLGAMAARFCASCLLGANALDKVYLQPGEIFSTRYSLVQVMLIEMWGTFLFTMVILNATGSKSSNCGRNSGFAHFTLCLALVVAIYICAPVSGGGMNPAVATGLNVMAGLFGIPSDQLTAKHNNTANGTPMLGPFATLWPYWVGPLLGATMSGLLQKHVMDLWHVECGFMTVEEEFGQHAGSLLNEIGNDLSNEMGKMGNSLTTGLNHIDSKIDSHLKSGGFKVNHR